MTEEIKSQILAIRQTGATNMFDIVKVKEIAELMEFTELAEFLPENKAEYVNFILTANKNSPLRRAFPLEKPAIPRL